jgi:hypothetical protein
MRGAKEESARIREFCWVGDRVQIMVPTISRHSLFALHLPIRQLRRRLHLARRGYGPSVRSPPTSDHNRGRVSTSSPLAAARGGTMPPMKGQKLAESASRLATLDHFCERGVRGHPGTGRVTVTLVVYRHGLRASELAVVRSDRLPNGHAKVDRFAMCEGHHHGQTTASSS